VYDASAVLTPPLFNNYYYYYYYYYHNDYHYVPPPQPADAAGGPIDLEVGDNVTFDQQYKVGKQVGTSSR